MMQWLLVWDFLIGTFGATIVMLFIVRFLPSVPFFRSLSLEAPGGGSAMASAAQSPALPSAPQPGEAGVAESALRPSGRARIGGEQMDVVTEGGYVDEGTRVRVVEVRGNVIVVRPEQ